MRDVGIWSAISISQPIDKKLELELNQAFRFDNNISNTGNIFTQFKSNYEILKNLELGIGYRWSKKTSWTKEINLENRYQIDLSYKCKIEDFGIKHRVRYQSKFVNLYSSEFGKFPENVIRNKTTFSYIINKKIKPYAAFEFFYPTTELENLIDKNRYSVGCDFRIVKNMYADVFGIYQNEINQSNPITEIIGGISITYELQKIKTKKKKDDEDTDEKESSKNDSNEVKTKSKKKKPSPKVKSEEPELPDSFDEDYD